MIKRIPFYILIVLLSCNQMIFGQSKVLSIVNSDHSINKIDLSSIEKITFTNTSLNILQSSGNQDSFAFTTVNKLYFETVSAVNKLTDNIAGKVFPDPASNFISIKNLQSGTNVRIYNLTGIAVDDFIYPNSGRIDISNLPEGIYIIKTSNQTLKFMKL